jgi:hypothetical protein
MPIGNGDLEVFFADFGVSVVFAGNSALGNFDQTTENDMFGDASIGKPKYRLELPANAFNPFPKPEDVIQVDGITYKVREVNRLEDGNIMEVLLKAK